MADENQLENLTRLNNELENYFRNTIIPQLFVDGNMILRKFTPPAMKQFNLSENEIGKPIDEVKDNIRFPTISENIQWVIDNNDILEKEIQTTDLRWYQMNILPYKLIQQPGKTNGVIITFIEITARIKDLKEQEKLIADYEHLLDTISHDIKNPLTSLTLTFELLKNTAPRESEKFQPLLHRIENSLKAMKDLILELTDKRKQDPRYKAEEELLSFESIMEDVQLSLTDTVAHTEATIKTDIPVSQVIFTRRKLRSIIYNLVSNSIKYRSPDRKPEILVSTKQGNGFFIITVKDNGMGIDPDKQEAIFSKYYRVQNDIEGSGVGLYLVNEIVKNTGGKITVESEPGKGTTFTVHLKVAGNNKAQE